MFSRGPPTGAVESKLSNLEAINVRQIQNYTSMFRRQLWGHFSALLDRHLEENEVRLIGKLHGPISAADWNVIDYLVKYVLTPSEQWINILVLAAYVVKLASNMVYRFPKHGF
ncbi:uncharacterized protein Pyn_12667 [Prunus yedoensis var. nudiflora]|uniref:Uncharacterized protein n=1 Tax=Prunus yedoensis var. nudiflora TaxID=2094558 RepID=A0A314ZDH4_PRUYE|nr:uncharacterized protein Pyn_12667 [Prunus yedoensis var. nudiflora]